MPGFPTNVRFDCLTTPGVLRVSYKEPPATVKDEARVLADPLDLWGVAWILNHADHAGRVVDVRPPRALSRARLRSLALRLSALQGLLEGFEFRLDGTDRWAVEEAEIRRNIKNGLFVTWDRSNVHRDERSSRASPEAILEKWIPEHAKKFLHGAFPHGLRRQFPASVFKGSLSEPNRALSRLWIDLLGPDSQNRLAAITLKVGEPLSLGELAEGLDHAIYCKAFLKHLVRNWYPEATSERIALYLVADRFHPGLLQQDDRVRALCGALRANDWLDLILVQIDSSGLPAGVSEQVVFPAPAGAVVAAPVVAPVTAPVTAVVEAVVEAPADVVVEAVVEAPADAPDVPAGEPVVEAPAEAAVDEPVEAA